MKKVIVFSLGAVGLVVLLLMVGCFPGAQFGAPGVTGIRGKVAMPGNNCYTLSCASPQVSEGNVPAPQAKVRLEGEGGQVLETQTDDCGNYEVSGASDSCYVLYADVPGGTARVKKGIIVESGKTNDAGEANYYTTAQVILYEAIKKEYPDAIECSDIPQITPPGNFLEAVRKALSECRDAQSDPTVRELAAQIVSNCFGAPACATFTVSYTPRPCRPGDEPKAGFEIEKIEAVDGGWKVTFKNTSTGRGNKYTWNFGDGTTSTEKDPVHTYAKAGTYTVALKAKNRCGEDSTSSSFSLAMPGCPSDYAIDASLSANPNPAQPGQEVTFTASATQSPTSYPVTYNWDLDGDGTFEVTDGGSTQKKTFATAGSYKVAVQAVTECGSATAEVTVTVSGCPVNYSITASLSANPNPAQPGQEVTFTASATQSPTSYPVTYNWDLDGDGTFDDGSGATLTRTFTEPGTYTVKVKAVTECGSDEAQVIVEVSCVPATISDFQVISRCDCPKAITNTGETLCPTCIPTPPPCKTCTIEIANVQASGSETIEYRYSYKRSSSETWTSSNWMTTEGYKFNLPGEFCGSETYDVRVEVRNDCMTEPSFQMKQVTLQGGYCCPTCNLGGENNCYTVTSSSVYNSATNKTTFTYTVTERGSGPTCKDVSHFKLNFGKGSGTASYTVTPAGSATDFKVNINEIKLEVKDEFTSGTITIVYSGCVGYTTGKLTIKAGTNTFEFDVCKPKP